MVSQVYDFRIMILRQMFIVVLCAASIFAQDFEAQVKEHAASGDFFGAVLVSRGGKVLYRKGFGMAQAEWDILNTPETKFRLGSITKQFTAVAVLQLVEQGKIKLDDPVKKFYPSAPAAWDAITIHHLLNHTSGIKSYTGLPGFFEKNSTMPLTPTAIVKLTQNMPLEFTPGSKFSYNNTGYVLLGAVLEQVTGKPYGAHLREAIFTPLGMKDTGFDVSAEILRNRAAGYERGPKGLKNANYLDMTLPHAAGSLYSTVDDLAKWDAALYSEKLIGAALKEKMFTPGLGEYGYGWMVHKLGGHLVTEHGGGINGFSTHLLRVPAEKLLVVTLANLMTPGAGKLAQELAKLALGIALPTQPKEIAIAVEKLRDYPGDYQVAPQFALTITASEGKLTAQATGQGPTQLFPFEVDKFFLKVVEAQVEFTRGADGKVDGLILHQNGRDMKAPRQ